MCLSCRLVKFEMYVDVISSICMSMCIYVYLCTVLSFAQRQRNRRGAALPHKITMHPMVYQTWYPSKRCVAHVERVYISSAFIYVPYNLMMSTTIPM